MSEHDAYVALNLATIRRQRGEIADAKRAIIAELDKLTAPEVIGEVMRPQLRTVIMTWLGHAYELGRTHRSEQLRSLLAVPAEQEIAIIVRPANPCPAEPHAHLAFTGRQRPGTEYTPDTLN